MGSLPTCGDAAAGLQRNFTKTLLPDNARQPNHDIQAGRSASAAASAKGLPKADLQACPIDPGDTAISVDVSDAQESGLCKVGASLLPCRHSAALQRSKADLSALLPSNAEYFEVF
ncbi:MULTISPECIES: hypothetical protein, partial [unclassified Phaeobacter]|uniref:hypothetical protein n=1 Tax=unclassified Phaeobacter TaxID=2621772 RepID=UPI003A8580A8